MYKVTVLYNHTRDASAFEKYYSETHMPLTAKIPNVDHVELTKFFPGPDGSPAAYYRMAELYFTSEASLMEALQSSDGQTAAADIPKFATGGFHFLIGEV